MVTVLNSVGRRFLVFSKVRLTSASPLALRVLEPLNTRASRFSLLRWLIFCSPITQRILSTIFDFPQPFGPTIPVILSSKFTTVLSAKLLKPFISKLFSLTVFKFKSDGEYKVNSHKKRVPKAGFMHNQNPKLW